MDSNAQDRQLPASEQKLKKAREDGQVARSRDLTHLAVLGSGALALFTLAPWFGRVMQEGLAKQLRFGATEVFDTRWMFHLLGDFTLWGVLIALAIGLLAQIASVLSALATGGWVWSLKPLMPDFSRLNPLTGTQQLLSKRKLLDVVKMSLITGLVAWVAYRFLNQHLHDFASLIKQPSSQAVAQLLSWLAQGIGLMLSVLLVVALIDIPLQIFMHKADLKMSRQELKDESKESDGNPQIKGRLRQRQRELAHRRSIAAVPKADFVVMNPTHFAVAVQYDEATMDAPRVVSKGADLMAMKIRDVAGEHAVPVVQAPMLARALYANSEIGETIPIALFNAVAQVLAYVYRLKAAQRGEGDMPTEIPQPVVPPELDPYGPAPQTGT